MWMLALFFFYFVVAEGFVFFMTWSSRHRAYDVILVLGCNGNPQSPLNQDRVQHAVTAKKRWPAARLMLSGNQQRQEISVLRDLLKISGCSDVITEGESANTWENMQHSKNLIKAGEKVLLVTSQFHQRRALAMARARGVDADSFYGPEQRYKKSALYFTKERLSIYLNFPRMLLAAATSKRAAKN